MMKRTAAKDTDEYLAQVPEPARTTLGKIRAMIRAAAPSEAIEGISYQMPVFKYQGLLMGFAAYSDHCSLFAMSAALVVEFQEELKNYSTSKGTIRFALDKPLPAALVNKLTKARVAQNERKKAGR